MRNLQSLLTIATAAALTLALAACEKPQQQSMGQNLDNATAAVKHKAEQAQSDVADAAGRVRDQTAKLAGEAGDKVDRAAESAGNVVKDATITAAVNAKLAADKSLSALRIDVDTDHGHVLLQGEAPNAEAKERATTLAAGVDGVVAVDNRLSVRSRT